ncbi:hypothetical protein COOONC_22349, partial [Cooperia oncophora]
NPGDRIRFELTNVFFKCAPTCEEFVEIKFARTHDRTGLRECCRAEYGEVVSQGDSILVITLATTSSQFNLRYRLERSAGIAPARSQPPSYTPTRVHGQIGVNGVNAQKNVELVEHTFVDDHAWKEGLQLQSETCNQQGCPPGTTVGKRYKTGRAMSNWCCNGFNLTNRNWCVPSGG